MTASLARRATAEFLGTGLLVTVVVGSGIMAAKLSPHDVGLELLESSIATALGIAVLILVFAPASGAHFNPVVTAADWWLRRQTPHPLPVRDIGTYIAAQVVGGIAGSLLANAMFAIAPRLSHTRRSAPHLWVGELVATAGLILLIYALVRTHRGRHVPAAVGAYIGAAYWFTSSTSFANPAVTIGRAFTDTFAGIAPASIPGFVAAQIIGAIVGLAALAIVYPPPPTPSRQLAGDGTRRPARSGP